MLGHLIERICRDESARVLAGLIRRFGHFDLAEDALQDAFTRALEVWPSNGLPQSPTAWLTTVAQRRALDMLRRRASGPLYTDQPPDLAAPPADEPSAHPADVSGVEDDRLRLVFTCCHPSLSWRAQTALALRTLCGLSTREIARAFVEPEATTAQRLVRARRKIADARIPYEVPARADLPQRLAVVLGVVYLVFNEGYAATESPRLVRADLCAQAIRLARLLHQLMPQQAEVQGLLAFMLLHDARRATRLAADGALVPLEEQDRSHWLAAPIAEGLSLLDAALAQHQPGTYQVQAAIAALHARAARAADTDWKQIAALYGGLLRDHSDAIVQLNAAAALAMAEGAERGLALIDNLAAGPQLRDYHCCMPPAPICRAAWAACPRRLRPINARWPWCAARRSGCICSAG